MGYSMNANEVTFWQGMAALLDPLAYTLSYGTAQSHVVAASETDYLVGGWYLQSSSGGSAWFHRQADFRDALPLPAGGTVTTSASNAGSHMLICQPSLVTNGTATNYDSRYVSDPRGLFFDRYMAIGTATAYEIGISDNTNTGATTAFPADFTYGLVVHASQHDASWIGLEHTGADFTLAVLNEVSDTSQIREAETVIFPFTRTAFPNFKFRGVTSPPDAGHGVLRYLKLPIGW